MKNFLLTLLVAFSALSSAAQENIALSGERHYYKIRDRRISKPEHEIRVGIGAWPISVSMTGSGLGSNYYRFTLENRTFSDRYNYNLIGIGESYTFGAVSAAYSYRPVWWFEVGATISYVGEYSTKFYVVDRKTLSRDRFHNISIVPTFRFNYYSSNVVKIYGKLGLGIGICINDSYLDFPYRRTEIDPAFQITLFGVSAGRRLFGYAEILSFGSTGLISAGIGYRFK